VNPSAIATPVRPYRAHTLMPPRSPAQLRGRRRRQARGRADERDACRPASSLNHADNIQLHPHRANLRPVGVPTGRFQVHFVAVTDRHPGVSQPPACIRDSGRLELAAIASRSLGASIDVPTISTVVVTQLVTRRLSVDIAPASQLVGQGALAFQVREAMFRTVRWLRVRRATPRGVRWWTGTNCNKMRLELRLRPWKRAAGWPSPRVVDQRRRRRS
jgi:hypothetical protein